VAVNDMAKKKGPQMDLSGKYRSAEYFKKVHSKLKVSIIYPKTK